MIKQVKDIKENGSQFSQCERGVTNTEREGTRMNPVVLYYNWKCVVWLYIDTLQIIPKCSDLKCSNHFIISHGFCASGP